MTERLSLIACVGNAVVGCLLLVFAPDSRAGLVAFAWSVIWFAVWRYERP